MPMMKYIDLETPRTPDEMRKFIEAYEKDVETYSNKDVHCRKGIIKDFLEEYCPLYTLVRTFPNVRTARLAPKSNEGPDGIIELKSGVEIAVQITVANESHQEALIRERLSRGQSAFATTEKKKNRRTGEIVECGRALKTKEERLHGHVQKILIAIKKKIEKFHEGTDTLVVATRISVNDSAVKYSWREDVKERIKSLGAIPYRSVYLVNGDEVTSFIE